MGCFIKSKIGDVSSGSEWQRQDGRLLRTVLEKVEEP